MTELYNLCELCNNERMMGSSRCKDCHNIKTKLDPRSNTSEYWQERMAESGIYESLASDYDDSEDY